MKLPNKTGTVYKLSGNRRRPYIARAYAGKDSTGVRKYKTIGYYETKTEATRALLAYNTNPYNLDLDKLTLADVFKLTRAEKVKDLKPSTIKQQYDLLFPRFFESLEKEPFRSLRAYHYQPIFDRLGKTRKKSYLEKGKRLLTAIYTYALLNDIVAVNYAKGVKVRGLDTEVQPYFTEEELAYMIKNIDTVKGIDSVVIMCLTGLRPSELLELSKDTVDLKNRFIRNVGTKTEAGRQKKVPIAGIIYPCIKTKYDSCHQYLYEGLDTKQMNYDRFLVYVYKPALIALGIPYRSPKACRHTFANITHNLLTDKTRQEIIGHTDIALTNEVYTDIEEFKIRQEFSKVEDYLAESLTKD